MALPFACSISYTSHSKRTVMLSVIKIAKNVNGHKSPKSWETEKVVKGNIEIFPHECLHKV